jgi:hypothetical protein
MNLEIETALSSWLRSLPEFDGIAIHTGQSSDEIPGDGPSVIAACEQAEPVVMGLYRATVRIVFSTPAMLDLDLHRQSAAALKTAILSPDDLPEFFPENIHLAGAVLTSMSESVASDRWITSAELVLGLSEI